MWWIFAVFVAAMVVSYVMMPKPQTSKPAGINEIEAPTAEAGREIPVLFGTRDLDNLNCVWSGDVRTKAIKQKGGKK